MAEPRSGSQGLFKALSLLISTAITLGVIEVTLRYRFPVRGVILQPDPVWLHEYVPNSRKLYTHPAGDGGRRVLVTINGEGHRGPEPAPPGTTTIAVYGDSFIAAEFSPWDETFCARLEGLARAGRASAVQVVDGGVIGYGPDQSLLRLEADLRSAKPALVLFAVYAGNDFGDLVRNKLFGVDTAGRIVERHPTLAPPLVAAFEAERRWPSLQLARAVRSVWERRRASAADAPDAEAQSPSNGNGALTRFDRWLRQGQDEYADALGGDSLVKNLLSDGYDAVVSLTPDSPAAAGEVTLMKAVLARAVSAASAAGVPMAVLVIPSPYDAVDGYPLKPDATAYPAYKPERLSSIVEGIARELRVPVINLFPSLSGREAARYFHQAGNDHWNQEGQQRAAAVVFERLKQEGLWR